jgi:molybdopterin molybdotransferase
MGHVTGNERENMISVQEAIDIIQKNLPELKAGEISLEQSINHVLAQDVQAPRSSPPFTNSAMDGFAVRWVDVEVVKDGIPKSLEIAGESQAGIPFEGSVNPNHAIRISTGAMLPEGTDTIIPIEDCQVTGENVLVKAVNKKAQHVRFSGEEFEKGETILKKGTDIHAPQLALLASVGISKVFIYHPPKISLNVTGTELVPHDQSAKAFQIHDSNSLMLAAAVKQSGGIVNTINHVKDDLQKTIAAIHNSVNNNQIILFSGGVSVGPHDHVKTAAEKAGFKPLFWKVLQKPGKPLFYARKNNCLLIGLPGNPVSAFMCYLYYVHPLVQALQGKLFSWQKVRGKLKTDVANTGNRAQFFRINIEKTDLNDLLVNILEKQGSHMLTSIAWADGFILLNSGETYQANQIIDVYLYPWSF